MSRKFMYLTLVLATGMLVNAAGAEQIWLEAESADTIVATMQIETGADASGGQYVAVAGGNNSTGSPPGDGLFTYAVTVAGGDYALYGRVIAPSGSDDSFWLRIVDAAGEMVATNTNNHGSGWIRWSLSNGSAWHWSTVDSMDDADDPVFTMPAGTYTVELRYREDGALLDAVLLTDDLAVDLATLPGDLSGMAYDPILPTAPRRWIRGCCSGVRDWVPRPVGST